MSWIASWFSPKSSTQGRTKALSATQEAFSMPSPRFSPHHDAYNADSLNTPDPDSAASSTYTYPPQSGGGQYGYVSTGTSSRPRPASLLPLHHTPLSPIPPYPPLEQTWNRLRAWLSNEYPELGDTLNYGIQPQDLTAIEMQFGFALPQAVRESYLVVDGQEPESSAGCPEGLFFGLHLLPLEEVYDEWRFWREVDNDPTSGAHAGLREVMQSIPPNWIRKEYSQRGWIPLISDKTGNYVGVDLNPAEGGSVGQVIVFGRDFDTKVVLWRGEGPAGWARWLASFVEELESGEGFELGASAESEGSEDDVGYESYFFDGTGRGSGDGNGEAGAGGMRLNGEYRGWNVLEAWADKSVRKWHEAGLVAEESPRQDKGKAPEKVGLGVLDLAKTTSTSGAEVPIPVLADVSNARRAQTIGESAGVDYLSSKPVVPTISVTKAPAPLPVDLPTQNDISPPSPESEFSSHEDIESHASSVMREVSQISDISLTTSRPRSNPEPQAEAALIPLPTSPGVPLSSTNGIPPPAAAVPPVEVTDLLADSAAALQAPPIQPSPSPSISPRPLYSPPELPSETVSNPHSVNGDVTAVEEEEVVDPDTTIRLVGGGGTAGEVTLLDEEILDGDINEQADVLSIASTDSSPQPGTKSEKKKSIPGLKKLGQFAGKRKKDSVSSLKEIL
ncbi:hypothetical protein BV25DRAFT_1821820 [Artomyces pyxidatus]|uniref:Uncharacterized protein n=1 Tax=Artomyces pyxidatus TaxID=48021 RepID=A0ACB8T9B4_9AGAM|nr:hypothetical protein BV25DRAFT_1821820 [Artomyces pyxidatus]